MMIVFCFVILPISEHSFVVKAMKKLYIARTKDKDLFMQPKVKPRKNKKKFDTSGKDEKCVSKKLAAQKEVFDKLSPMERAELDKHHKIKISFRQSAALFWENVFSDFCCGIFLCECFVQNPKRSKLAKLYDICQDKIDAELDVVKIIKNLKNLRIIAKTNIVKDPIMKI